MSKLILLTVEQADAAEGGDGTMAALRPVALTDGRFIVSAAVLADPAHAARWPLLAGLPQCEREEIAHLLPVTPWPPV